MREWGDSCLGRGEPRTSDLPQRSISDCPASTCSAPPRKLWGGEQEQVGDQTLAVLRPATAELLSSLEDLELSNRRLAGENAKLQRSVETAEEGSARLGEEIAALRKQLRRSVPVPSSLTPPWADREPGP